MANLKEQEKWEEGVYQIEENDPVLGGENGITNKPIKQLANRTLWLKKALELFGKKSVPKDLTAESTSTADEFGHSHKLPVGSTTEKGIWQATSDTSIDSDGLVLTAKAGKKLAQLIATVQLSLNNYIPINKRSSVVNSNDENNVATSKAVKTAYDKGVEAKNAADNAQRTADSKQSPATTLAGYGIGNFKIEPFVGNLNTLKTDGVYAITQASRSQNLPVAGNGCHIQVIAGGDGRWCRQIAYIAYSTDMYERHQTSYQTDSWSDWVKLNDIEPVRQLVAQKANLTDFSYQKIGNFEIRKYPDGTMIQSYLIEQYDLNVWQEKSFNWAQAFISIPMIFSKITTSIIGPHDCDVNILTKSNNRTCYYHEYEHGASDQGNVRIEFLAMGRWK